MHRSEHLQPLSHDHYYALLAARRLMEKLDEGDAVEEIACFARRLWTDHFKGHFEQEETHVMPALRVVGASDVARQLLAEHVSIRDQVRSLRPETASRDALLRLATDLRSHARFEEREAFPALEERADAEMLAAVGAHLHHEATTSRWEPSEWP